MNELANEVTSEECIYKFVKHDFGLPSHRLPVHVPVTSSQPWAPTLQAARYWEISYCKRCHYEYQEAVGFTPAGGDEHG